MHPSAVTSFLGLLLAAALPAHAQVYQCTDAAGKKIFSQTPCAAQGGSGEKKLMGVPAPAAPGAAATSADATPPAKDWAAENAAANARANRGNSNGSATPSGGLAGLRRPATSATPKSDKQIVSECEANHGARCNSGSEIAQRRMEERTLTPAERQQQQNAIAARKQREMEESFNRR